MVGRLCDREDVARIVREKLDASGVLSDKHVFVYGFDMITPAFAGDLICYSRECRSLTLAVESDKNAAPDGRLFAPVNRSIDRLIAMAKEQGISVQREHLDLPLFASEEIKALENRLFALDSKKDERDMANIQLRQLSTPRAEVHAAASKIRHLISGGADPSDLAVVYPGGSMYCALVEHIFPMYGLPVYVSAKRAASGHPLCRFILSALSVVSDGFKTSDVVECIQSGFLPIGREEADALCAYAEGVDLRGDAWKHPFRYIKSKNEEELAAFNATRERAVAPLIDFSSRLGGARTADDTIAAVLCLLDDAHAFDTLETMRDTLLQAGFPVQADDCAQVWNRLMETLDQLHALLGGDGVGAALIRDLLSSGLSAMELAALPPADGAIICGEIGNVRTAQVDTLFAIGMNDEAAGEQSSLLTEQETQEAALATGAYLGMSPAERTALAQLDTLKALTCARSSLYLSYAMSDETGRALREGTAVLALKRRFPRLPLMTSLGAQEMEDMLSAPLPAAQALAVALSDAADGRESLSERAAQAYSILSMNEEGSNMLLSVTRKLAQASRPALNGATARMLYGRPVMSVSRLETFAQGPYRHFVRYGLSPQEELRPGVDRAELGTLYHEAAETFTRAVTQLPEFPNVDPAVVDKLMHEAAAPLIDGWRASPLGRSARGASIASRIDKIARRTARNIVSQFASGGFRPLRSELVFGQKGMAPIVLSLADGTVIYLQGRIDRVDVIDGEGHIRIIDYKSGTKKFDATMAYWGLQLQLLLYLGAALAQIPGSKAAGFFYCRIADPMVRSESRIKEEIEKQIAKKLSLAGISLSDVSILRAHGAAHAAMITKDGKVSGRYAGSLVDEEGMADLLAFAREKAARIALNAYAGVIDDAPAERGQYTACSTCDFAAVCGFDPTRQSRRRLSEKRLADLIADGGRN